MRNPSINKEQNIKKIVESRQLGLSQREGDQEMEWEGKRLSKIIKMC